LPVGYRPPDQEIAKVPPLWQTIPVPPEDIDARMSELLGPEGWEQYFELVIENRNNRLNIECCCDEKDVQQKLAAEEERFQGRVAELMSRQRK
jgi:hypothetical protein